MVSIVVLKQLKNELEGLVESDLTKRISGVLEGHSLDEEWNWNRQVIESVTSGVVVANACLPDLPLIYVNSAFERMTGYRRDEILGGNCRFLQGSDTDQPGLESVRQAILKAKDVQTVLKNYRKDGSVFWNELYMSPIRSQSGRLTHYVGIQHDVTLRVELERKLAYMAHFDPLTGLANRSMLMDRIEQAILRAKRNGDLVAVLFFDLDNFKLVNDMFGHDAGDSLLKTVADRFRAATRGSESASRLGGDEFVVVVENFKHEAEAEYIMRRITYEIKRPTLVSEQEFLPSASVGLAIFPRDGSTPQDLLHASDMAMYVVKHQRREKESGRQQTAI
jgi:diguanylate cyclase (GGDEF)-like protein/PAS domain S-box-containing protein